MKLEDRFPGVYPDFSKQKCGVTLDQLATVTDSLSDDAFVCLMKPVVASVPRPRSESPSQVASPVQLTSTVASICGHPTSRLYLYHGKRYCRECRRLAQRQRRWPLQRAKWV